jgi:hypothetical protein
MRIVDKIHNYLDEKIPNSTYSDGTQTKCLVHRIASLLDPMD